MNDEYEIPSSQRTNEDPTGPVSVAAEATLTLTPNNAEAKLAFSQVSEWLLKQDESDSQPQPDANSGMNAARQHAKRYMWISREQSNDDDVSRLLRHHQTGNLSSSSSVSVSSPPGNSPADTRVDSPVINRDSPKCYIWTGCYFIDLSKPPLNPARGWAAGRMRTGDVLNDMVLCLSETPILGVRQRHAVLQIRSTNRVSIQTCSGRAPVYVDGKALATDNNNKAFFLNSSDAMIRFGNLLYRVEYGRFAREDRHRDNLKQYLEQVLGNHDSLDLSLIPTPKYNIQIGQWSLTDAGTIGSGGEGRVSVGINLSGRVVVLKRVVMSTALRPRLRQHQQTMEEVTQLAKDAGEDRILRLVEVISDDVEGSNRQGDVWFVLEPVVTPLTAVMQRGLQGDDRQVKIKHTLVAVAGALNFLHSNCWIHGDIKPPNIGARDWDRDASSIVLLDIDDCIRVPAQGGTIPANPGSSGTVGWISPERELEGFNETTDVWSLGVVALWMLRGGSHPWMIRVNPWRKEPEAVMWRVGWKVMYSNAIAEMKTANYGGLVDAVLGMVRFPYAEDDRQKQGRPTAEQLLALLNSDKGREKRMRRNK